MGFKTVQIFITMCCYMASVIGIGLFFARVQTKIRKILFIGGRTWSWVAL
jgi:sodium/proline symporter